MQISQLDGNPIVMGGEALLDTYYPVGRIYLSSENVSPASFMGGSWERIEDVFLLCAGTTYAAGSTGGAATHGHNVDAIARVLHVGGFKMAYEYGERNETWTSTAYITGVGAGADSTTVGAGGGIRTCGATYDASNMPPYRAIYAWERVE